MYACMYTKCRLVRNLLLKLTLNWRLMVNIDYVALAADCLYEIYLKPFNKWKINRVHNKRFLGIFKESLPF